MGRTAHELRAYADEHLLYEIRMVAALTTRMTRQAMLFDDGLGESDEPLAAEVLDLAGRNADIEAWVTHLSNVVNFLFCNRKHGDVVAYDFFEQHHDWTELLPRRVPTSLERVNARVPIEIDHMSFGRTRVKDKTWLYERMWRDLAELLRLFVDSVPSDRVSEEFRTAVQRLLPADPLESIDRLAREMRAGMTLAETYQSTATGYEGGTATLMPRFDTARSEK